MPYPRIQKFSRGFYFLKRLANVFHKNKTLAENGETTWPFTYVVSPEFLMPQICLLMLISEFTIALTSEYNVLTNTSYADPESCVRGDKIWQRFFFVDGGEWIQIPLTAGHHRPASETPFNGVSQAG